LLLRRQRAGRRGTQLVERDSDGQRVNGMNGEALMGDDAVPFIGPLIPIA
jgi:hypothetical protein